MPPPARRRGGAATAALLLLGLLLLSAGPRLAAANHEEDESPSPSPSPSPEASDGGDGDDAPPPAPPSTPDDGDLVDSDVDLGDTNSTLTTASDEDGGDGDGTPPAYSDNAEGTPLLTPSTATVEGREVYYEVPQDAKGLLVFFHGCYHNAYDFWPEQEACPECRGLPEEVSHTKQALAMGYAFAAINSLDRREKGKDIKCFS
ncbi:hypothetical protein CHLNCDRAFT_144401 [Chlorella variabilis]|uniref:Uncharacterized protein n=1 Tax=Chlorella variabilis TaxID=554065 RepID=E1ZBD0_CHLVA|nr:hypothetical protein CHLNCDRAFT_144401 [Chlorella variabilis]EFN56833.1 hypothetical protein CHLNCDRAFT_144401 [Chlorella variabilis]|eukprot:XP_005848935.1 hypothetical protein CHLNCDRAFT_144401 [Chlorella variabilis]